MISITCLVVTAGAALLILPDAGQTDPGTHPDRDPLQRRIAELEARSARDGDRIAELESRLAGLEAEERGAWLTRRRADELRQIVHDVLADADTRSSLIGSPLTAGYDDGLFLSSADGNWLLRTNLLMQQRLVFNKQTSSPTDDSRWGFENTRTKITLSGHMLQPDWFYSVKVELGSVNRGHPNGEDRTGLNDALVGYDFGQGWKFWLGSFKTPLRREELVQSQYQLAAERSVVNYVYTGGYTDGLAVDYRNTKYHFTGSYNNGINDLIYGGGVMTGGTGAITTPTTDLALTFRGEWLIMGAWDQVDELTSPRDTDRALMLGGALHYQMANDAPGAVSEVDLLLASLDFTGHFGGASVFAELIYAYADRNPAGTTDAIAVVVQGGYYLAATWEGFARYEWSDTGDLAASDISILTVGFTKYLARQKAKWITDFGIAFDPVPFAVPVAGWRADAPGETNQFVVRSQFQISF